VTDLDFGFLNYALIFALIARSVGFATLDSSICESKFLS